MSQEAIVLVQLQAKSGHEADVERLAGALFERIRGEEEGCLQIGGHRDPEQPGHFMFFEIWRDADEFNAFRESRPYMQEYFKAMEEHVVEGEFSLWEPFA